MSLLALINFNGSDTGTAHNTGPLALGVVALIGVAVLAVTFTYWRAARRSAVGRPRRGTTAVLLAAIATVVLGLTSVSQHRIASLTIVSHATASRTMTATPAPAPVRPQRRPRLAVGH